MEYREKITYVDGVKITERSPILEGEELVRVATQLVEGLIQIIGEDKLNAKCNNPSDDVANQPVHRACG